MSNFNKSYFIARVLKHSPAPAGLARSFNESRHRAIIDDISDILDASYSACFGSLNAPVPRQDAYSPFAQRIWMFWWQGVEQAPSSVRACIESVRRNAGGREVVVIDKRTVGDFVSFPQRVLSLVDDGTITLTHFSDLLRYALLARYGGVWMDCSMYAVSALPLPQNAVWTCGGYPPENAFNVSEGRWLGGYIGGPAQHPMFRFMSEFFSEYWAQRDELIDYFLIDYAVDYAWRRDIGGFAEDCVAAAGRNPALFNLRPYLDKPFDQQAWASLSAGTGVFIMNYKWTKRVLQGSFADVLINQPEMIQRDE